VKKKFVSMLALMLTLVVSVGAVTMFADTASYQLENEGNYTLAVEQEYGFTFSPFWQDMVCDGGPGAGRPNDPVHSDRCWILWCDRLCDWLGNCLC